MDVGSSSGFFSCLIEAQAEAVRMILPVFHKIDFIFFSPIACKSLDCTCAAVKSERYVEFAVSRNFIFHISEISQRCILRCVLHQKKSFHGNRGSEKLSCSCTFVGIISRERSTHIVEINILDVTM